MFKKIVGFLLALCVTFALTGCSTDITVNSPEPTSTPIAIYNVGERVQADSIGFIIKRGQRVDAAVDKAHVIYGIYIEVRNYDSIDVPFSLTSLTCYAGDEACPIYEGLEDSLNENLIPAKGVIEGWVYYKIPATHTGISFTYTYNESGTYILFVFEEG